MRLRWRFPVAGLPLVNSVRRFERQFVAPSGCMLSRSQPCAEERERRNLFDQVSVHTYLDSSENWKFFFRLRHSGTKNAGFRKTVYRVEFFLANACLLETLVSVRNRTAGRRGRQNVCVWQTWQGYYLRVLSWSPLNILCFLVFCKKISLKESEAWRKVISKQNYCHVCLTRFAVFLPLPSCCVSSLLRYEDGDGR